MKGNSRQDISLLLLRLGLGLTMVYFGSQKALGVFGGMGYMPTVNMFQSKMGVPIVFAHLAILAEFLGGLGILFGFLSPIASFGVACTMAVATFMNMKAPGALNGIFTGGGDPSKLFFPIMLLLAALVNLLVGPGAYSVDNKFFRKKAKR